MNNNLEGFCDNCGEYSTNLDIFLYLWNDRIDFCCLKCLYEYVRKQHLGK